MKSVEQERSLGMDLMQNKLDALTGLRLQSLRLFLGRDWEYARNNEIAIIKLCLELGGFASMEQALDVIAPQRVVVTIAGGDATRWKNL